MLAAITQTPELALDQADAERLSKALSNVSRHYKLPALAPDKMALGMLFWTAGRIYAPRVMAISSRKQGKAPAAPAGMTQVHPEAPRPSPAPEPPTPWFTAGLAGAPN